MTPASCDHWDLTAARRWPLILPASLQDRWVIPFLCNWWIATCWASSDLFRSRLEMAGPCLSAFLPLLWIVAHLRIGVLILESGLRLVYADILVISSRHWVASGCRTHCVWHTTDLILFDKLLCLSLHLACQFFAVKRFFRRVASFISANLLIFV